MVFAVPQVDISPYVGNGSPDEKAAVAAAIDAACRSVGFIQITGHGVPDEVIAGLGEAMDAFFDRPLEAKRKWIRPASENRGYTAPKSESLSLSLGVESADRMNDFFEAYNIGRTAEDRPQLMAIVTAPENQRRLAHIAAILADSGQVVLVPAISPLEEHRALARQVTTAAGLDFFEVFMDTPLEDCERRDPKGLYAKARAGEITHFTGIDSPYQRPKNPDLRLTPDRSTDELADQVIEMLAARG